MRTNTVFITVVIILGIVMLAIIFFNKGKDSIPKDLPSGTHAVAIKEVIQTSKYTYFRVAENENIYWIAVTKREAREGDVIYYSNPLEMNNFFSKELERTFQTVFFVQDVSDKPMSLEKTAPEPLAAKGKEIIKRDDIKVNRTKNGITIADLYEHSADCVGKTVKIRGVVTRYNSMVMGKNWVHIQDGTDFSGNFDLAVTTLDNVALGNTVTFTGEISLNKDFGAGYFYKVIVEEAKATDIKPVE